MKAPFILLLFVVSFGPIGAVSADYSDGWDAYKKENYLKALVEWLPLAEQGAPQAQYNLAGCMQRAMGLRWMMQWQFTGTQRQQNKTILGLSII